MITKIQLQHYKCFEMLKLPLGKLTMLSGLNSSGKTSVLQSLVLLSQTVRNYEWSTKLHLNTGEIQFGTLSDIVDNVTGRSKFGISIEDEQHSIRWTFRGEKEDMSARVSSIEIDDEDQDDLEQLHFLLPQNKFSELSYLAKKIQRVSYLSAERMGPREMYKLSDPNIFQAVGPKGENAASLLFWKREEPVLPKIALEGTPPKLIRQVERRMQDFFPKCIVDVYKLQHTNNVSLKLGTANNPNAQRPIHAGFGLTQVFPILVAALSSKEGDLLLVENPEVHLHPKGQALIGEFLCSLAMAGVQVLLETHSDHVLNGLRRAVKKKKIHAEDVALYYFQDRAKKENQVYNPIINEDGEIDTWPEGFFDQFDEDMNFFAGWGG